MGVGVAVGVAVGVGVGVSVGVGVGAGVVSTTAYMFASFVLVSSKTNVVGGTGLQSPQLIDELNPNFPAASSWVIMVQPVPVQLHRTTNQ